MIRAAVAALLLLVGFSQPASAAEPVPAGTVMLQSSFETWDSRWQVNRATENTVWVANGQLAMGIDADPDGTIRSARVDTSETLAFTYGTFRARMRFVGPKGAHAAGWLQSSAGYCNTCSEVDMVEHFGGTSVFHTLWTCPCPSGKPTVKRQTSTPTDPAEWHTYKVEWTPTGYTVKVDGEVRAQWTEGLSDQPHFLALSYLIADWEWLNLQTDRLGQYRAYVEWADLVANKWTTVP